MLAGRRPLKVLFFSATMGAGGAEKQMLRLLQSLDRRYVTPHLSVARGNGHYESQLPADVSIHVCTRGIGSSLLSMVACVPALRKRINLLRPDVVLSILPHSNVALLTAAKLAHRRPAVVLGMQNNFVASMAQAPRGLRKLLRRAYLQAYAEADHLVALSCGVATDLGQLLPGSERRTSIVYNAGVDDGMESMVYEPLDLPLPAAPLVVACGRLNVQKDYPTLLRALAQCSTSPAPHLWILGEGNLQAELQSLVRQLGLSERVRFLGFRENPYRIMAAADVFALSSRWEGFANVVVEAMACGTPVVSTDCPHGPGEILQGGKYGRLVPVGDVQALASALDAGLAEGKGPAVQRACRQRAAKFDSVSSAQGYQQVFERVVGLRE